VAGTSDFVAFTGVVLVSLSFFLYAKDFNLFHSLMIGIGGYSLIIIKFIMDAAFGIRDYIEMRDNNED